MLSLTPEQLEATKMKMKMTPEIRVAAETLAKTPRGGWPETEQALRRFREASSVWKDCKYVLRVTPQSAIALLIAEGVVKVHPSRLDK